jgi:hypothetical protein
MTGTTHTYTTNRRVSRILAYADKLGLTVRPMDFNTDGTGLASGWTIDLDDRIGGALWVYAVGANAARVSHWLGFGKPQRIDQWLAFPTMSEAARSVERRRAEDAATAAPFARSVDAR